MLNQYSPGGPWILQNQHGTQKKCFHAPAGRVVLSLLAVLFVLGLAAYLWLAPASRRVVRANESVNSHEAMSETNRDQSEVTEVTLAMSKESVVEKKSNRTTEQQLEGEWTGYYQGQRRLTVRSDGTGVMTAKPDGFAATFLAAKLTFEIRWKMNAGSLEFETVGGEPLDKVNLVLRMYGAKRSHRILKLAPNDMTLLDEDGVTKYEWHRLQTNSGNTKK